MDLYEILGVSQEATQDEIRKAYRELARKYHPDKTGGDKTAEDKLKAINAAYDVLKNKEKRKEYDQQRAFGGGFGGYEFSGGGPGAGVDFEDILSSMFGGRRGRTAGTRRAAGPGPVAGSNLEATVRVKLKDVLHGTKKTLRVRRLEACGSCGGSGAAKGSKPSTCPECGGTGEISRDSGFFQLSQTCPRCRGTGQVITNPCSTCGGAGRIKQEREIVVEVPPGVENGTRLRIGGEGEAGIHGGPRGNLFVKVTVDSDAMLRRDGSDLICDVPVTITEAALGAKVKVPTLEGTAQVTVPAGTASGTSLRMRSMGLPNFRKPGRGDQRVIVNVEVPRSLTPEQRKMLTELGANAPADAYPERRKYEERLRRERIGS